MSSGLADRIKQVRDFKSLVDYLRTELDWPIESDQVEELAFEWEPDELGLSSEVAVRISSVKQLRPLIGRQPWGIFYIEFESKTLPVVLLRRILKSLTFKKKASADRAERRAWDTSDLLFICAAGEVHSRGMTFAHFEDTGEGKARLKTFSWDESETHFHYLRSLNLEALRWPADASNWAAWRSSWSGAFITEPRQAIRDSKQLSTKLAGLAQRTRDVVSRLLEIEAEDGPLHALFSSFKTILIHDLNEDAFADMLAQTIAYGLFSARVTGDGVLGLEHLEAMIPNTNPFLRELFVELASLGGPGTAQIDFDELGVGELVDLLNDMDVEAILQDFGKTSKQGAEDPVIHFYEDFLKEYDSEQRMQRGVFYTPRPVVSFIVRSIDEILLSEFGLEDGLADTSTWGEVIERTPGLDLPTGIEPDQPFVRILDPATGTGTFLVEVIDVVYSRMAEQWRSQGRRPTEIDVLWNEYVDAHLLPRLNGYELLMAPYAIAHLKIGLKLHETGYRFSTDQRVRVYMTNSLEPPSEGQITLPGFPALAHEAQAVSEVKRRQRFTVVLGNPPYSGVSSNMGPWIGGLLKGKLPDGTRTTSYYHVDGEPLGERKVWLQDDYVKFIRLSQWILDSTGTGVHGFITNHGYLDNPTFRGMRQSLMQSFGSIAVLDLHGNLKKKEIPPDGGGDTNVFDIQQGVAIGLFFKHPSIAAPGNHSVLHADMWGKRELKYERLLASAVDWGEIGATAPFYLFEPFDQTGAEEYESWMPINEIMPINVTGVLTARDGFVIDFERDPLLARVRTFLNGQLTDDQVRQQLGLKENYAWRVGTARQELAEATEVKPFESFIKPILYRPFDERLIFWHPAVVWRPRTEAMPHMLAGDNTALISCRQQARGQDEWTQVCISSMILESCAISNVTREINYAFPLFLYSGVGHRKLGLFGNWDPGQDGRVPNLDLGFVTQVEAATRLEFVADDKPDESEFGPTDILAYLYAVLHSPEYRQKYDQMLKLDFARVPSPSNREVFRLLAQLGRAILSLHLLNSPDAAAQTVAYSGSMKPEVGRVGWSDDTVWLDAGAVDARAGYLATSPGSIGFVGVPGDVWRFKIGAYQVCHKWLKDRKGRILGDGDIAHYQRIATAIGETIRLMAEIDDVIEVHGGWPGAFAGATGSAGDR